MPLRLYKKNVFEKIIIFFGSINLKKNNLNYFFEVFKNGFKRVNNKIA